MTTRNLAGWGRNPATGMLHWDFNINDYYYIPIVGLGIKTSVPYYDDFESRSLGAVSSAMGNLTISNTTDKNITTNSFSGTRALECAYTGGTSAPARFPKAYLTLPNRSNKVYFSCRFKFSGTTTGGANVWKFLRFSNSAGNDPYNDSNKFSHEMTSSAGVANPVSQSSSIWVDGGFSATAGNLSPADDTPANLFQNGQWIFYEGFIDAGTVGNADAEVVIKTDNKIACRFLNRNFLSSLNPQGVKYVLTPMNGIDDFTTSTLVSYMDEIYVDGSLARCIMTDNSNYAASTNSMRCAQVLSFTTSDGAYLIRKRGLFSSGQTAYYHFWNTSGVYVGYVSGVAV